MESSITVGEELRKYFYESGLNFLSSVPQRRIQEMILAMAQKGHSGKMTDCGELGMGHRTTYGHFLSKGKWDHEKVETIQRQKSFQTILSVAGKANQPVFLSIDDTVVPKKNPSRRAARPMEGTGWHYSHLEGKKVYGYQIHAAIASTGSSTLCYSLRRCCPEHGTKVDMTVEVIDSIQESEIPIYVLMDSWYTNADVWNKYKGKKCHLIGTMKTNRILYPQRSSHFCQRLRIHAHTRPVSSCNGERSGILCASLSGTPQQNRSSRCAAYLSKGSVWSLYRS